MKKIILVIAFALSSCVAGWAQAKPPAAKPQQTLKAKVTANSVQMSWTNPVVTVPGNLANNLYKCTGKLAQCPVGSAGFAPITPGPTSTTYTDTAVVAGASYVYQVTADCTTNCGTVAAPITGEGVPSNQIEADIPANPVPPGAPTLSLTSVL